MKSYTDLEQSKKLAEILPVESADMYYAYDIVYAIPYKNRTGVAEPCWSLAALLQMMPHCIDDGYDLALGKLSDNESWYVCYDDVDHFVYIYITKSNLIDACVEMIIRLKENNLI